LSGFADLKDFQRAHCHWVEQVLENGLAVRDDSWSEAIAVGSQSFVEKVKGGLGFKAAHRDVIEANGTCALREAAEGYGLKFAAEKPAVRVENTFFWDESIAEATT
jgi:putative transposase